MTIEKEDAVDDTRNNNDCTSNSNDINLLRLNLFYADEKVHVGQEFIKMLNHYDRKKGNDEKSRKLS